MKIAVVLEYLPAHQWREQWWAVAIARGLRERGHDVVVLCDGAFDVRPFEGVTVEVRRPERGERGPRPVGFRRWARRRARAHGAEVLSLTALVPAPNWLPLERAGDALTRALGQGPLAALLEIAEQPSILLAAAIETLRRPASPLTIGAPGLDGVALGFAALQEPPVDPHDPDEARRAARAALGIADDQTAVLFSATRRPIDAMKPALRAMPGRGLLALTAGPFAHSIDEAIRRAAPDVPIRHAGFVRDMAPVLLSADAVCIPDRQRRGTGRLAAEALLFGRPILAAFGAPGASLIVPQPSGAPGLVVPSVEARTWEEALARASDPKWLQRACRAAHEAGRGLSLSRLLDRLEKALGAKC